MRKQIVAAFLIAMFLGVSVGMNAWVRPGAAPVRITEGLNVERVADVYRVHFLGEKSVLVPSDEGGTGQRFMVDVWALQVRGVNNVYADLEWAWGEQDLVRSYLESRMREEQARVDVRMFMVPGYTPKFDNSVLQQLRVQRFGAADPEQK